MEEKKEQTSSKDEVKEQELEKEEKAPTPKPYPVFGTNCTATKAEFITYYKYRMKMMIMKYKLVGHVDDNGQYVIGENIKRDLVKMEKEIEDQAENYYKAIALYMKKHFYYSIRVQVLDDGRAKASLFLSEFVDDFLGHEYIVSHIADFVDVNDDDYRIKLRKAFHLVDVATKVDDFAVPDLAVIMQDAFDFELIAGDLYDAASQIYLMSMLKEIEESGPLGQEVLTKYRALLADKNIEVDEKFRYTSYKALLDRIIDEYGGYEGIGLDPAKVSAIVMEMNKTLQQVDKASMRGPLEMQGQVADQNAVKKAGGKSKPKGAVKKAEPVKKPEKKKPDEKKKEEEKKKPSDDYTPIKNNDLLDEVVVTIGQGASILGDIVEKVVGKAVDVATGLGTAIFSKAFDIDEELRPSEATSSPSREPEIVQEDDLFKNFEDKELDDIEFSSEDVDEPSIEVE